MLVRRWGPNDVCFPLVSFGFVFKRYLGTEVFLFVPRLISGGAHTCLFVGMLVHAGGTTTRLLRWLESEATQQGSKSAVLAWRGAHHDVNIIAAAEVCMDKSQCVANPMLGTSGA